MQIKSQWDTSHPPCACASLVTQSCPTLWDTMDCSPPGSSVHRISQARILEWVASSFSRGSPQPRDWTHVSCISRRILYCWATWEAHPPRGLKPKRWTKTNLLRTWENGSPSIIGEIVKWFSLFGKKIQQLLKMLEMPCDPAIPFLGITAPNGKQSKCPSPDEIDNLNVVYSYHGILFSHKKKWLVATTWMSL